MKNSIYNIEFNELDGTVLSLKLAHDADDMNWCAEYGKWGYVHQINYDGIWGDYKSRQKEMTLISFEENDSFAKSVYSNDILQVTVERFFDGTGNFCERFILKNLVYADLFLNEHNCSIEVPFKDLYTYADDCLVHCCNAHIWCGLNTTYIDALKMGVSENNIGLVVTKGSFGSYSILDTDSNKRGRILLDLSQVELMQNEEYIIEWVIFPHMGKRDFLEKAGKYHSFINIEAENYTLFKGEAISFTAKTAEEPKNVRVYDASGNDIEYKIENNVIKVDFVPQSMGELRIYVEINGIVTYAEFMVKENFDVLLKNRIDFLVDNQQYKRPGSSLDGAFLIYDNKENHMIFEDCIPDHNACQERVGMGLLLAKYLQTNKNEKFYNSLLRYIGFVKRELFDAETGYVYNSVGKDKKRVRLYNAPWASTLFTEMYYLTGDKEYLKDILRILSVYYDLGGDKFYPNGISILRTAKAFSEAGMTEEYTKIYAMFEKHVNNIVEKNTSYPKHEVNFEQTIVSPAATFISEFAVLSGDERYVAEAKKHIDILERFNGSQPSYHMNEIPIRYWDDYWFGKFMMMGDTFPHYWSCLTARSYKGYYNASGDEEYLKASEKCMRNCLCLFTDDGRGSAAYVYPYRCNGQYGRVYDDWANDQDFALYFALVIDAFKN